MVKENKNGSSVKRETIDRARADKGAREINLALTAVELGIGVFEMEAMIARLHGEDKKKKPN